MSTTPQQAAAEIAANEYAFNMASEPEPTRTHFLNGFMQGVAWRPEVSETREALREAAIKGAQVHKENPDAAYTEDEKIVAVDGYITGYEECAADAAERIAELEEQCAVKDKAIAEALEKLVAALNEKDAIERKVIEQEQLIARLQDPLHPKFIK